MISKNCYYLFYMNVRLRLSSQKNVSMLLSLIRLYHEFEGIEMDDMQREKAVILLLGESPYGRIWLIESYDEWVGYIAICFGYTIEFGGRDAFLDEFYIQESHRGQGIGARVLRLVQEEAKESGGRALHLEVARSNERAQRLYDRAGFDRRERYFLMSHRIPNA